jgi:hypothetical protein
VLHRLNEAAGLGISPSLLAELRADCSLFGKANLFEDIHFSFEEREKHLDVVDRARGLGLYLKATQDKPYNEDILLSAFETLTKALERSPLDP